MGKWNRAAIDAAIETGVHQEIALPRKVPVAWIYLTAWMTRDQTVQFRNDIYDQDEQLLEATAEEAAAFMESLANNHPFLDGNKRVAFAAAHTFLLINGFDLEVPPLAAYKLMTQSVSAGKFRFGPILEWIDNHIRTS